MTLPTLSKTWNFDVNNTGGVNSSAMADGQLTLHGIKNAMKALPSPWTVISSCDKTTAENNTGVDLLDVSTKLYWAYSGSAHSWIVLEQAGVGAGFQVCFDLNQYSAYQWNAFVSPSAGFGSVNGGTNGTTLNRPTATDEINISGGGSWGPPNSAFILKWHLMQSTDGECNRLIICNKNTCGFWIFDKPRDPITAWTVPVIAGGYGTGGTANAADYTQWNTGSTHLFSRITDVVNFYMTGECIALNMWPKLITGPDDLNGEWPMLPIGLVCSVAPHRGKKGTVYDLWWGSTGVVNGSTYPDDGTRQFVQFDHLIFPWNGSLPLI